MTIKEIIEVLQESGHVVAYSKRKDGGYIIRKIDNRHYSGKTGNVMARKMTGTPLSLARQVQLARIRTPKGKRSIRKTPLPDDLKKALRRVQRNWRKKHPTIEGTISTRGLRYQFETYGKEKALASLDKAFRYSQGYAYLDNVMHLIERIKLDLAKLPSSEMEDIVSYIEMKTMDFKEEWLSPIYSALYDWERGIIEGKETARIIRQIMM